MPDIFTCRGCDQTFRLDSDFAKHHMVSSRCMFLHCQVPNALVPASTDFAPNVRGEVVSELNPGFQIHTTQVKPIDPWAYMLQELGPSGNHEGVPVDATTGVGNIVVSYRPEPRPPGSFDVSHPSSSYLLSSSTEYHGSTNSDNMSGSDYDPKFTLDPAYPCENPGGSGALEQNTGKVLYPQFTYDNPPLPRDSSYAARFSVPLPPSLICQSKRGKFSTGGSSSGTTFTFVPYQPPTSHGKPTLTLWFAMINVRTLRSKAKGQGEPDQRHEEDAEGF